jgi:hypothetical protein
MARATLILFIIGCLSFDSPLAPARARTRPIPIDHACPRPLTGEGTSLRSNRHRAFPCSHHLHERTPGIRLDRRCAFWSKSRCIPGLAADKRLGRPSCRSHHRQELFEQLAEMMRASIKRGSPLSAYPPQALPPLRCKGLPISWRTLPYLLTPGELALSLRRVGLTDLSAILAIGFRVTLLGLKAVGLVASFHRLAHLFGSWSALLVTIRSELFRPPFRYYGVTPGSCERRDWAWRNER